MLGGGRGRATDSMKVRGHGWRTTTESMTGTAGGWGHVEPGGSMLGGGPGRGRIRQVVDEELMEELRRVKRLVCVVYM